MFFGFSSVTVWSLRRLRLSLTHVRSPLADADVCECLPMISIEYSIPISSIAQIRCFPIKNEPRMKLTFEIFFLRPRVNYVMTTIESETASRSP